MGYGIRKPMQQKEDAYKIWLTQRIKFGRQNVEKSTATSESQDH